MGDGFLLEFASALEASRCAIEIQRAFAKPEYDYASKVDLVHAVSFPFGERGIDVIQRLSGLAAGD